MLDTFEYGAGLVRFGCPLSLLFPGDALCRAARMKSATWKRLAIVGKGQGADSNDWWGRTKLLSLNGLVVQVMNADMEWEAARGAV
ncbi:hypothetical protein EDC26_103273 [Paralcaligenes ureilyticus]|uniref:Uncharacterized protein n=1 Tax=Paralcaligenes ureilyticus TaxID=627131 RepID=A0A4R3M834_9BURK|nr:hypothetical protein EDC26_103273 [Paralcaligenes ureilyticus]